jgi:hypothetical protein
VQAAGVTERKVVMSRSLPPKPSLRFLKEEAKDLLRAQRHKEATVCPTLRLLRRFRDATDQQILSAEVGLQEVQFALAMEYGFPSWDALVQHVRSIGEAVLFRDDRAAGIGFRGDRLRQDTFSLAVTAGLGVLGRAVDYRTVHLRSGNAFAPDIRPEEPTRSHWQLQGRERCLDVIAASVGVEVRPFPDYHELADIPPMPKDQKEAEVWLREYYAKPAASYLSHALQTGEMVVSCGEWAGAPGLLWCDWGLVVEARSDGTILGAAANGRSDNLITHIRDGWILRAGGSPLPAEDIRRQVLRRAVQRIRGEGPPFRPGSRGVLFGLPAMDAWISAMAQVPFDVQQWQGKDHSLGHARETALPTFDGSKAAAAYLRRMADDLPVAAAVLLQDGARHYDRIAELLEPVLADGGLETYQAIMGDEARQRQHAQQTLQSVRQCLETVAGCIEATLGALDRNLTPRE